MGARTPHELMRCVEVTLHPRLRRDGRPRLAGAQGEPLGALPLPRRPPGRATTTTGSSTSTCAGARTARRSSCGVRWRRTSWPLDDVEIPAGAPQDVAVICGVVESVPGSAASGRRTAVSGGQTDDLHSPRMLELLALAEGNPDLPALLPLPRRPRPAGAPRGGRHGHRGGPRRAPARPWRRRCATSDAAVRSRRGGGAPRAGRGAAAERRRCGRRWCASATAGGPGRPGGRARRAAGARARRRRPLPRRACGDPDARVRLQAVPRPGLARRRRRRGRWRSRDPAREVRVAAAHGLGTIGKPAGGAEHLVAPRWRPRGAGAGRRARGVRGARSGAGPGATLSLPAHLRRNGRSGSARRAAWPPRPSRWPSPCWRPPSSDPHADVRKAAVITLAAWAGPTRGRRRPGAGDQGHRRRRPGLRPASPADRRRPLTRNRRPARRRQRDRAVVPSSHLPCNALLLAVPRWLQHPGYSN